MPRKKHFLNNRDLYDEIIKSKEQDELTQTGLRMLMLLAERCSTKLIYINPQDKEDCIAYAYLDLYKYWRGFDPNKGTNAFAYFTEIAKRGLAKGWNKLHPKKYAETISLDGSIDSDGIYSI